MSSGEAGSRSTQKVLALTTCFLFERDLTNITQTGRGSECYMGADFQKPEVTTANSSNQGYSAEGGMFRYDQTGNLRNFRLATMEKEKEFRTDWTDYIDIPILPTQTQQPQLKQRSRLKQQSR